jgi:hypothetical protein
MFSSTTENKTNLIHAMLDAAKVAALGVVLTFAAVTVTTQEAEALCLPATGTTDPGATTCTAGAGGYDADGFGNQDIDVRADGEASDPIGIDLTGSSGSVVLVFDIISDFGGTAAGSIVGTVGEGVLVTGDNNFISNGDATNNDGGGSIVGATTGVSIDGEGNIVTNINNGGGGTGTSGLISGGGGAGDDGVSVRGGTYGSPNIVNNGAMGSGASYIISGGTVGAAAGDSGIAAAGVVTINNGDGTNASSIQGGDEGIEYEFF